MVSPEITSGHLNWRDRDSHFIFGDVATAVLVEDAAIAPAMQLLHAQVSSAARRGERKRHHALQIEGRIVMRKVPGVRQHLVRLDGEDFAVQHAAPLAA